MTHGKARVAQAAFLIVSIVLFFGSCAKKELLEEEAVGPSQPGALVKKPVQPGGEAHPSVAEKKAPEETTIKGTKGAEKLGIQLKEQAATFEGEDVHFDFDKYDLKPKAREILTKKAEFLRRYPTVRVLIEGHCDERGTNEYNLALGERRANSVKQYLIQLGISADRLSTISYGEERPLDPRHNEQAWAKNRRAHLVIVSY